MKLLPLLDWVVLLLPVVIGYPIAACLVLGGNAGERIPYAWFIGVGFAVFALGTGGYFGVHGVWVLLVVTAAVSWLAGYLIRRKLPFESRVSKALRPESDREKALAGAVLIASLGLVAMAGLIAIKTPVISTDVKVFWLPKAKLLADPANMRQLAATVYPDYPPAWPLHLGWVGRYLSNQSLLKALPTVYVFFALWAAFCFVRSRAGTLAGGVTVFFFSANPYLVSTWTGLWDILGNVPMMTYTVVSSLALARYAEEEGWRPAILLGILGAAAILFRPEAFIHVGVIVVIAVGISLRSRRVSHVALIAAAPALAFLVWRAVVWWGFGRSATYTTSSSHLREVVTLQTAIDVVRYCVVQLAGIDKLGAVAFLAGMGLTVLGRSRAGDAISFVFFLEVTLLCGLYCILPATNEMSVSWWLATGFNRMLMHMVPLAAIAAALAWGSLRTMRGADEDVGLIAGGVGGTARLAVVCAISGLILLMGRTRPLELADVVSDSTAGLYSPLSFGGESGWWQNGMPRNSIMTAPASNAVASTTYNLYNLGARNSSAWISGTYSRLETSFQVVKTEVGEVRFSIAADSVKLFESEKITGKSGLQHISVVIPRSAARLELRVDSLGDNNSDHAVWVEPRLIPSIFPFIGEMATLMLGAISFAAVITYLRAQKHMILLRAARVSILLCICCMAAVSFFVSLDASYRLVEYCMR